MWRLLEVGEKIKRGDEYWGEDDTWSAWSSSVGMRIEPHETPSRRRVQFVGADISAEANQPDNLVKLGDHIGINCGTWLGCTGRVFVIEHNRGIPTRVGLVLDNVYAGGRAMTLYEAASNVTVLVDPVAVDPEWRLLDAGEVVQAGDETLYSIDPLWRCASGSGSCGIRVAVGHHKLFRRKTTPFAG